MSIRYKGKTVSGGLRGLAGPDGNPIGTVISHMGLTAPQDYLVCDGAEYNIADHSELAEFFEAQFGAKNYFGGDGTATFAVPDLRNLFLRGYHGTAIEQLSGDIGKKQEATRIPNYGVGDAGNVNYLIDSLSKALWQENADESIGAAPIGRYVQPDVSGSWSTSLTNTTKWYTTRPVNVAVLYCIKAVTSVPASSGSVTMEEVNAAIEEALKDYVKKEPEQEFTWWSPHMTSDTTPNPYVVNASSVVSASHSS